MPCNIFLAGNSEVSLELQCFTAELITYIVCECDAPEWLDRRTVLFYKNNCTVKEYSSRVVLCYCTIPLYTVQKFNCTSVLYHSTTKLYSKTAILYWSTMHLFSTGEQLYICRVVQLYSCTTRLRHRTGTRCLTEVG